MARLLFYAKKLNEGQARSVEKNIY
ncbi:hypothetical protein STFR1_10764 [Bacillus vallismortis]